MLSNITKRLVTKNVYVEISCKKEVLNQVIYFF